MRCPSCQFENIPGVRNCGRCAGSLVAGEVAGDVHPPRASVWQKRWRRSTPTLTAAWEAAQEGGRTAAEAAFGDVEIPDVPQSSILSRLIVPGWAHIYSGHVLRGRIFLGVYCALLFPGLLFLGTASGSLLVGLAVACHASSVLDLVVFDTDGTLHRLGMSLLATSLLCLAVYVPAAWLLRNVLGPMPIRTTAPPLAEGDVLIVNFRAAPRVGDVFAYELAPQRFTGRTLTGANANIRIAGLGVDRILAGPGDSVEVRDGRILVDGEAAAWSPLHGGLHFPDFQLRLEEDQWFVLPSAIPYVAQAGPAEAAALSLVSTESLRGRVVFRSQPLWRFGRLESRD